MRTEDDLREALVSPPDPERAARVITTIVAETGTPVHRRRPVLVGLAAAVVLAVAVGIGLVNLPRDAVPIDPATPSPVPTPTSTPVTNERVEGNWRLTHRVDLPPGWTVSERSVEWTTEFTSLRAPGDSDEHPRACGVTVWGVGEEPVRDPSTKGRKAVTVNGRPGYTQVTTLGPHRFSELTWEYRDDAWAKVNCSIIDDFVTVRDIAERVVFMPTSLRVPLRLTWIPDGFRVTGASDLDFDGGVRGGWSMGQRRVADGFAISVNSSPASKYDLRPGQPGTTTDVIAGYPAVLQAEWHRIQLDAGAYTIELTADGYRNGQTEWAPGRRELLVRLAESLVPAPDLGDRNTWFDARAALPR